MKRVIYCLLGALALLALLVSFIGCAGESSYPVATPETRFKIATTTSLYDTGLWAYLEPLFEKKENVELDIVYAGTGKALEYGSRGDVDIVVVHSKSQEAQFIADGYGVERVPFAYNYFLIVGPPSDPAGIKGMSPEEAFKKLMETGSGSFVSRGDDSGTHTKEKAVWKAAGYDYEAVQAAGTWYIEAGSGMGPTLMMANEKQAYTLTDIATYASYHGKLEMVPIVDKGDILLNVYSAIAVNPQKVSGVETDMANKLISFLTSVEGQEYIGKYGVAEYGIQLFTPCAGAEPQQ